MTARLIGIILSLTAILAAVPDACAQLSVIGGNITATITTGIAGGEPVAVSNSSVTLRYRLQSAITKITVRTSCPGQRFNLGVVATAVPQGVAAPQVTLVNGMLDVDLIVSIPPKPPSQNQNATLLYTASATFAQGNSAELGNDVHTVTYTLIDQ